MRHYLEDYLNFKWEKTITSTRNVKKIININEENILMSKNSKSITFLFNFTHYNGKPWLTVGRILYKNYQFKRKLSRINEGYQF